MSAEDKPETEDDLPQPTIEEMKAKQEKIEQLEKSLELHRAEATKKDDAHTTEVRGLTDKITEITKGENTSVKKAVNKTHESWTAAIADRVAKLPASWAPGMVAKKIVDPDFMHPQGVADFQAKIDENNNVVRHDGDLVPAPS